jgi:AraC family transcriptional regulator
MPAPVDGRHREDTITAHTQSVERVILYMKSRLDEPMNLAQLAEVAAISKFHFIRIFEQITYTTPHNFLACLRIERAKYLLVNSTTSVTQICMDVGYSSLGSFSRTFAMLVGVAPISFRKQSAEFNCEEFYARVKRFSDINRAFRGHRLEGRVEVPNQTKGFIFVGAFSRGVPQGAPISGTVIMTAGYVSFAKPRAHEFYLLSALLPANWACTATNVALPAALVASERWGYKTSGSFCLRLRDPRVTDPPLVVALSTLFG